jgi:hypothetical protein
VQHDRHHEVQLGIPRRMSRRRSADVAARRSTARLSAARILRIGTAGLRNARKFACTRPAHAPRPHTARTHTQPRPERTCTGSHPQDQRPTGPRTTRSYPLRR